MRAVLLISLLVLPLGCADRASSSDSGADPDAARDIITIPDELSCPECRIVLDTVTTVGTSYGAELLTSSGGATADSAGNILVADPVSYPGQLIYRPAGSSEWRTIGSKGEGPGEFVFAVAIWISAEGLHVVDSRTARETVYDATGNLVGTYRLPAPPQGRIQLADGRFVHASSVNTPGAAGYPLHLLGRDRQLISSFGTDTAMLLPGARILNMRAIALSGDGAVWSARMNEYRIEKWSVEGQKLLTIRREADWFEPWITRESSYTTQDPKPSLAGVAEDENGLLWVLLYVPAVDHRPVFDPDDHVEITEDMRRRTQDTVIEVMDPRTGELLARGRFDDVLRPNAGPMLVGRREIVDHDGSLRYSIVRMRLDSLSTGR